MIASLLSPTKVPDWIPDDIPVSVQPDALGITTFNQESSGPIQLPSDPPSVEDAEANALTSAAALLGTIPSTDYNSTLLQDPVTAPSVMTLMVLGEVQRQTSNIVETQSALSKLPKRNLLSSFRMAQVLTLNNVISLAESYINQQSKKSHTLKTKSGNSTADQLPIEYQALQELMHLSYLDNLGDIPSIPSSPFTRNSITLAAKSELLAERAIELFAIVVKAGITGPSITLAYQGMMKAVNDSSAMIYELLGTVAKDQAETLERISRISSLSSHANLVTSLSTNHPLVTVSDTESTDLDNALNPSNPTLLLIA